jgi:hypothetical protein
MYGNMSATSHVMTRQPTPIEWEVAETIEDVLKDLCSLVNETQALNSHWLLFDAIQSIANLDA